MTAVPMTASAPKPKGGFKLTPAALIWPALLYLIMTTQVPFFMTIYYSFFRYNLVDPVNRPFVGFANYAGLLTDPDNLRVLGNSAVLTVGTLVLTLLLGGGLAMLLHRNLRGPRFSAHHLDEQLSGDAGGHGGHLEEHAAQPGVRLSELAGDVAGRHAD